MLAVDAFEEVMTTVQQYLKKDVEQDEVRKVLSDLGVENKSDLIHLTDTDVKTIMAPVRCRIMLKALQAGMPLHGYLVYNPFFSV